MSLTPADAQALRHALATVVVVPVTPVRGTAPGGLLGRQCERGQGSDGPAGPVPRGRPPAEPSANIKDEIRGILREWDLA
jgi:hypothetical protein